MIPARRYPWPASALSAEDMAVLHRVRETAVVRVPITVLIAQAVRRQYATDDQHPASTTNPGPHLVVLPANPEKAA